MMGVLYPQEHIISHALRDFLRRKGIEPDIRVLKRVYNKYKVGKISNKKLRSVLPKKWEMEFLYWLKKREEAKSILLELRRRGYRLGVITNLPRLWGRVLLKRLGVPVDVAVISGEVGVAKPHPLIFKIFLERSGAKPEECIYIDDKSNNVETARSLGMKAITFVGEWSDGCVRSLHEVKEFLFSPRA